MNVRVRPLAVRYARLLKYAVVAPLTAVVLRHTNWLDGRDGAPPVALNYAADGDFVAQGLSLSKAIDRAVPLTEETRLLDIGCGIGRLAWGLKRRGPVGRYFGFDVVRYGIRWCRKTLTDPRFTFRHVDVRNSFYNPFGRIRPVDFTFPCEDASFDLAVAISVFTHLPEAETRRYFAEAMRCLDDGGRAYFTTFLPEHARPGSVYRLAHRIGAAHVERREEPDMAVGYSRAFWEVLAARNGAVLEQVLPGSWAGQPDLPDYQDVLIFRRVPRAEGAAPVQDPV